MHGTGAPKLNQRTTAVLAGEFYEALMHGREGCCIVSCSGTAMRQASYSLIRIVNARLLDSDNES